MRHHLRTARKGLTGRPPTGPPPGPPVGRRPEGPAGAAAPSRLRGDPGRWAPGWWVRGRIIAAALTPLLLVAGVVAGVAAPASADTVPAPPSGWTTVFSDDFPDGVCGCTSPDGSTSSGAPMNVGYVAGDRHHR